MNLAKVMSVFAVAVMALAVFVSPASAATTVVVTGNTSVGENQPGWLFNRDVSTSTPYEFNKDQASIGNGSLYVLPIGANAADKFIGENFINLPVADVEQISYDFLIGSSAELSDANQFYMNVYANFGVSDDFKFYDCRYNVVPVSGSQVDFTTVTFDPNMAYPVATRGGANASPFTCPAVPAEMDLLSPGSTIRVFALNVGDTSTSDFGVDGYLDNVVVNTVQGDTVYDFEPAPVVPLSKDECKKGGWMTFTDVVFKNQGDCVSYVATRSSH